MIEVLKIMKKRKGNILLIVITLIVLVIAITSLLLYNNSLKTKPKTFFVSTIDRIFEQVQVQEDINSFLENVNVKTNLRSDNKVIAETLNILNHMNMNFKAGIDYNTHEIRMSMDSNYNEETLLNSDASIMQDGFYINVEDIYNKTILIPINKYNYLVSSLFDQNNIKIILKSLNMAINDSLQDKYFSQKEVEMNLNDKNVKVNKNTLALSKQNLSNIIDSIKNSLLNNDEFLNSLSSVFNKNVEEIKEDISNINTDILEEIVTISLYTQDNQVIGFEVARTSADLSFLVLKNDEFNYSYELKSYMNTYKGNIVVNKKDNNTDLEISINHENINGTISIDVTTDKNVILDDFKKENIIKIDEISDQERVDIFNNLQKIPSIRLLIKDLWNLIEI